MKFILVYVTTATTEEAKTIAKTIVKERLAACANILGDINSIYWWQGELCEDNEVSLIFKTRESLFTALAERVRELHSYDCPAIVALDLKNATPDYLAWIENETTTPNNEAK